nr:reverse transcriptase domain-containing protein [Tanacetum cinerariifolium]
MPLSVWKELGLPELIPTCMTLELANRAICTPVGIAKDVFVQVRKFTFPVDFVIVDYENDPRVPLILGRPFLRTARALIDVHGEEMILRDSDKRLTLNMRHDTSSYSNQPQRESDNLINIFNVSIPLILFFSNSLLEEFTDELTLITYPLDYDDNLQFDIKSDLKEIEFLLYQDKDSSLKDSIDQKDLANLDDIFVDHVHEMFTDEYTPDYSYPSIFDVYNDDFLEVESDVENVNDASFDSKEEKIKEFKLLIDELDLPCDFFLIPRILIHEKPVEIITRVAQDTKLAISNSSLVLEDFDPPFYEPLFFKEVPKLKMLLLFSFENEEKVFKPGIYISEK